MPISTHPGWDTLRVALPEGCRGIPLASLGLPAKVQGYAERRGMHTLGGLAGCSAEQILAEPHLGRLSLHRAFVRVRDYLAGAGIELVAPVVEADAEVEAPPLRDAAEALREAERARAAARRQLAEQGLLASWEALRGELSPMQRRVMERRSGLDGRAAILDDIGAELGRSRERVRQIEGEAVAALLREKDWLDEVWARVDATLRDGAVPLASLAGDPWWAGAASCPDAIGYFGERVLEGRMRVVDLWGEKQVARFSLEAIEEAWETLRERAEAAPLPAPLSAFHAMIDPFQDRFGTAAAEILMERLSAVLHVEEGGGEPVVTGVGTRGSVAVAILRASPVPIHKDEVFARVGARANLPDEVILFGQGMIGLEQHFPDFAAWSARLVPPSLRIMRCEPRQWNADEILARLREEHAIPAWLDAWHLVGLLQRSGEARHLGYKRLSIGADPTSEGRLDYGAELVRILRRAGRPMTREALIAALRSKMGVYENHIHIQLMHPPFLRCAPGLYGLRDRDLPGGARALDEALAHVAAWLSRRGRGALLAQVTAKVRGISRAHARWTPEMCASALHGDARFRFKRGGGVGLSRWESARVPSRLEMLRA